MNKVKYLLTYRYSEIIHDLTVEFTKSFLLGHLSTLRSLSNLSNLSHLGNLIEKPRLPDNPQDAANFLLTLCHQETYLLDKQINPAPFFRGVLTHAKKITTLTHAASRGVLKRCWIKAMEGKFIQGGGFTENLFRARRVKLGWNV